MFCTFYPSCIARVPFGKEHFNHEELHLSLIMLKHSPISCIHTLYERNMKFIKLADYELTSIFYPHDKDKILSSLSGPVV